MTDLNGFKPVRRASARWIERGIHFFANASREDVTRLKTPLRLRYRYCRTTLASSSTRSSNACRSRRGSASGAPRSYTLAEARPAIPPLIEEGQDEDDSLPPSARKLDALVDAGQRKIDLDRREAYDLIERLRRGAESTRAGSESPHRRSSSLRRFIAVATRAWVNCNRLACPSHHVQSRPAECDENAPE